MGELCLKQLYILSYTSRKYTVLVIYCSRNILLFLLRRELGRNILFSLLRRELGRESLMNLSYVPKGHVLGTDITHLLYTLNIKETQNHLPFQKINWEQNSHSYRFVLDKNISLTYVYKYIQVISARK